MSRIALVVLAAGTSRRFGALDKLAMTLGGRPLLAWTLDAADTDVVERRDRLVVIGPGSVAASRIAEARGWRTAFAHDAARGMGASLRAGLFAAGADDDVAGAIVLLGDDPLAARMLDAVATEAITDPGVAVAVHRTPFLPHPVYLPRASWPDRDARVDDHGLRDALGEDCSWIDDPGDRPLDVDVPADIEAVRRRLVGD